MHGLLFFFMTPTCFPQSLLFCRLWHGDPDWEMLGKNVKELQITSWRVLNCKNKQTKNSKHKTGPFIYLTFNCASKMTWRWCIYRWKTIQDYIWISRIALMQLVTAVVTWLSIGWNRLSTNQKANIILRFPFPSYALVTINQQRHSWKVKNMMTWDLREVCLNGGDI